MHAVPPTTKSGARRWLRMGARLGRWAGVAVGVLCSCAPLSAEPLKEHQIKAAFLYNFTKFVEWPAGHFANEQTPIVIGVVASEAFERELNATVAERLVNGRRITVKKVALSELAATRLDLVYFSASDEGRLDVLLSQWRGAGVLTVGESEQFAELGGMITFTRKEDKVRFKINLGSAEQSGFRLSSKLLGVAESVKGGGS